MAIIGPNVGSGTGAPGYTTVNRFGVPVGPGGGAGILMPKLKHRFRVVAYNFGSPPNANGLAGVSPTVFTQQVVTAGRPQVQFDNTELHSYNSITYIAQKPKWQTIEMTFRDDITNQITSLVSAQLQSQMNFYTQSAAAAGINYKFSMSIQTLDGTVNTTDQGAGVLESWFLEGCYIETAQYDSLDFSNSEAVMITLTIRYDNATQGDEIVGYSPVSTIGNNSSGNTPTIGGTPPTAAQLGLLAAG